MKNLKSYYDGERIVLFHKSPLVEMIASLHSMLKQEKSGSESLWLSEGKYKKLNPSLKYNIESYGKAYSNWLLIMDLATYISCRYFDRTGETEITFQQAMQEYRNIDDKTYLYFFLGMPALGLDKESLDEWINAPDSIKEESLEPIEQYIKKKDIVIIIKNIKSLRNDIAAILKDYWYKAFSQVWDDIERNIDKTIKANYFECEKQGNVIQYVSNIHNDIALARGKLLLKKEVIYEVPVDKISQVHIFPSTFSNPELLMDWFDDELVVYYNINLSQISDDLGDPTELEEIFKALGDSNRLRLLKIIWGSPTTNQYLSKVLGLAPSTVSEHLKVLKNAGLITSKSVKRYVYYEANSQILSKVSDILITYLKEE